MAPTIAYAGNISYKNKGEIAEILSALGQETTGLKHDLEERLEKYLEDNASDLREDNRFKGLYVKRKRRSNRGSETPTPSTHGAGEDFDALKTATGNLAEKALDNATQTYKESIRPVLSSAYEEGTNMAGKAVRSGVKKAKEVTAIDENSLKLPDSPARALRSQANQAVDNARPIVEDVQDVVENVSFRALKYWRENGANELKDVVRLAQKKLSNSQTLVKVMLFSELVYLLIRLIPWYNIELQFPPSQYSFSPLARFVHAVFFWMPEYKRNISLPETFAMLRPSSNALGGAAMWLVYTVLPPTLISRLISFLPQPAPPAKSTKGARSPGRPRAQARPSVFPTWDPLVFCLIRLAIVILPLTSAAPDAWRYQLEALGSTSGRALVVALTTGFVVADRLAALAE